jgi:glycosyltransferase involved in cell wall biosynthesis
MDNSYFIMKEYAGRDERIQYIHQENQGLSAARNNGIKSSHGKYILPLDADDLIHEDYIAEAVEVLGQRNDVKVVYCRAEYFGEKTGEWKLPQYNMLEMLYMNCIFCTAMYRRTDFDQTSGYNTNMKYGWEDWDFWLSLLEKGGNVYQIPQIRFYYRVKKKSMLADLKRQNDKNKEMALTIMENHLSLYRDNYSTLYNKYVDMINSRWCVLYVLARKVKRFITSK